MWFSENLLYRPKRNWHRRVNFSPIKLKNYYSMDQRSCSIWQKGKLVYFSSCTESTTIIYLKSLIVIFSCKWTHSINSCSCYTIVSQYNISKAGQYNDIKRLIRLSNKLGFLTLKTCMRKFLNESWFKTILSLLPKGSESNL